MTANRFTNDRPKMGRKFWRWLCAPPPWGGRNWVHILRKVAWDEAYLHAKYHLDPFSRLATINMGLFFEGELRPLLVSREVGPCLTQSRLGRGLPPYQVAF